MAKKNITTPASAPQPARRRSASGRAGKTAGSPAATPIDIASVTPTEPIDTAADIGGEAPGASYQPNYDEVARAAYHRYLSRGGIDGRDFDDWIEAERELAARNGR